MLRVSSRQSGDSVAFLTPRPQPGLAQARAQAGLAPILLPATLPTPRGGAAALGLLALRRRHG